MAAEDPRIILFNTFAPLVATKITEFNLAYAGRVNFIIKGGASIEHHITQAGIAHEQFTYDIDVAPLFLPVEGHTYRNDETYIPNAKAYCDTLYAGIAAVIPDGFSIARRDVNGLLTMQAKVGESDFMDIIDFSYIDPDDEDTMFVRSIAKYYPIYRDFVIDFINQDTIFSPINIEICVVVYGVKMSQSHLDQIPAWRERVERFTALREEENRNFAELEELFGVDQEETEIHTAKISGFDQMIASYTRQLSEEFIGKIQNKIERYRVKGELLIRIGGDAARCE